MCEVPGSYCELSYLEAPDRVLGGIKIQEHCGFSNLEKGGGMAEELLVDDDLSGVKLGTAHSGELLPSRSSPADPRTIGEALWTAAGGPLDSYSGTSETPLFERIVLNMDLRNG